MHSAQRNTTSPSLDVAVGVSLFVFSPNSKTQSLNCVQQLSIYRGLAHFKTL